ncbi:alpha/beta fold hydrolase [uncultured Aliiroseovarius sp.]|uniref:alpha/beta hydrolase n=1 Tax=uncultured Aliiroseovarius sp. TaxID=1658783 RepID=UPI0025983A8E|nr:alpha/beta fold hydrolase [uncultured Aliiroseovarius sp.]
MRFIPCLALILLLASCAPRGKITLYAGAGETGELQRIYVGTTREIDEMGFPSGERSRDLIFGRFDVSVPPDREPGSIEWPRRRTPDPKKHFLLDNYSPLKTQTEFQAAVQQELRTRQSEQRTAIVFVHGFNNNFAEGLYRFAQLTDDLALPFIPIHYSWPSAGHPLGYGYDRDSMLIARDGLETVIRAVSRSGVDEILLVGHSMGALLTMETLRQMTIADGQRGLRKIGGVVLLSPDIDIDVFRAQADRIGDLPQPFFIFTSTHDVALRLSAGLTGQSARLGNTADVEQLAELNVTMVDISAFSDGKNDHMTAFASASFLRLLRSMPDLGIAYGTDPSTRVGLLPGTVLVVQNATRLIIPNVAQ